MIARVYDSIPVASSRKVYSSIKTYLTASLCDERLHATRCSLIPFKPRPALRKHAYFIHHQPSPTEEITLERRRNEGKQADPQNEVSYLCGKSPLETKGRTFTTGAGRSCFFGLRCKSFYIPSRKHRIAIVSSSLG